MKKRKWIKPKKRKKRRLSKANDGSRRNPRQENGGTQAAPGPTGTGSG